jgi:hypothetical protein
MYGTGKLQLFAPFNLAAEYATQTVKDAGPQGHIQLAVQSTPVLDNNNRPTTEDLREV